MVPDSLHAARLPPTHRARQAALGLVHALPAERPGTVVFERGPAGPDLGHGRAVVARPELGEDFAQVAGLATIQGQTRCEMRARIWKN